VSGAFAISEEHALRLVALLFAALLLYALWRAAAELPLLAPRVVPLPPDNRAEVVAILAASLGRLTS